MAPFTSELLKCNVDTTFFNHARMCGFGMCLQDDKGFFVMARMWTMHGVLAVKEGEVLGLLDAMRWVQSIGY